MRHLRHSVKSVLTGIILSAISVSGTAETELCVPFTNGLVDESVVAQMLASAEKGYLYRVNPSSSRMGFCIDSHVGRVDGEFRDFEGGLTFQPASVSGQQQAMIVVHAASLDTSTPMVEGMLKGEKFFNIEKYPEIVFVSREFRWVNRSEAILIGDLTLHGITKAVGFHVQLIAENGLGSDDNQQIIHVKATTLISRSEFGIDSLASIVDDVVSLCMTVEAVQYRPSAQQSS